MRLRNVRGTISISVVGLGLALSVGGCSKDSPTQPPAPPAGEYATISSFMGTGIAGLGTLGSAPGQFLLYLPQDLTFGPDGLPYVLDWNNHRVVRVRSGAVEAVIGTAQLGDAPEGPPLTVNLNHPTHISFDLQGRLVLSAWHNSKIMRLDFTSNWLSLICGDGTRRSERA